MVRGEIVNTLKDDIERINAIVDRELLRLKTDDLDEVLESAKLGVFTRLKNKFKKWFVYRR